MLAIKKWIAIPAIAACLAFTADTSTAEAGNGHLRLGGLHISVGGGHHGYHRGHHHGYHSSYTPRYRSSYRSGYGGYGHYGHGYRGSYHDTSHYDWHPTQVIRHGNHWDIQPGHYDYHRSGHWHH
ncbi:hypothetical protein Pla52o_20300 [Novipirellula galeiformis]|uniref:Uncharacterized protein n=1 Tax=Novipirellula galeiformis TaxID=2528004 RepID=A0A5C6CLT3_9BACT|nr:hypothetical protein [Novipirellula galeiformis]TWU24106.1 hypothetical protein Pla52o_20300 [Novipirellula galeiformis]